MCPLATGPFKLDRVVSGKLESCLCDALTVLVCEILGGAWASSNSSWPWYELVQSECEVFLEVN
jgi:hypothetical protein